MKKKLFTGSLVLATVLIALLMSCSKTNSPGNPSSNLSELTTLAATTVTQTTAQSGGIISSDGGATVTARGVCWNTSQNPTTANSKTIDGAGTGSFNSSLTGLLANTIYYVRAYATNNVGTSYGTQSNFTTQATVIPTITTVNIGTQVWTSKNLDVARYRNGDPIPKVTDAYQWASTKSGAYCYYDNDSAKYAAIYGKLYNWYAVMDSRGLAPAGYHIPTVFEWIKLYVTYLGGGASAGYKLKETGTAHWESPNANANNGSHFTGLPGGYRYFDGRFANLGVLGNFWSTSQGATLNAGSIYFSLTWNDNIPYTTADYLDENDGFSVRCIKD